MGVEVVCRRNK